MNFRFCGWEYFEGGRLSSSFVGNGALINNIYIYIFIKHHNENQLILCRIPRVVETLINEANFFLSSCKQQFL